MNKAEIAKEIWNTSYLTGEFKLRSGIVSNEYFDKYQFESNPMLLYFIAHEIKKLLPLEFDYLAALEMGGIPVATAVALIINKPVIFVRKKPKEYGTCKYAEGPDISGKKLVIVEDVVTSGGQVILSAKDLRDSGAIVESGICVIDRESGGIEKIKDVGIELKPLFTMSEIKRLI